jgi:hypothetical protein
MAPEAIQMIRTLLASLTLVCMTPAAFANTFRIDVTVPADLSDEAAVTKFVAELKKAVRSECARANSPMIGLNYDSYAVCVKAAEIEVAKQDTTGLFAAAIGVVDRL